MIISARNLNKCLLRKYFFVNFVMATNSTATDTKPLETRSLVSEYIHCHSEKFDYVIIGSSFCAYGFVEKLLRKDSDAKILVIEKGSYCQEIQGLSPVQLGDKEKRTEAVPWKFMSTDSLITSVRGINHFVGGRSSFWKAWCPTPTREEMIGWPDKVVEKMLEFYPFAKELLGVKPVNELTEQQLFSRLQNTLFVQLQPLKEQILEDSVITRVDHAPLALLQKNSKYGSYQKFSVVEPLIERVKSVNVELVTDCEVTEIIASKDSKATDLSTSKGSLSLGKAKLILAMSTLPCTILAQNSSIDVPGIGERFTGHFASYSFARVPCKGIFTKFVCPHDELELAALYVAGLSTASGHQFHIQLTAVAIAGNGTPNLDKMRHLLKTPKANMIEACHNHIVFVCASLGQVDHENPQNKFYPQKNGEHVLEFEANDKDKELWKTMDKTTFKVLEHLSASNRIEYWNSNTNDWQESRPSSDLIRHKSLVHPASTMWIGDDDRSPVDLDYKLRGMDNVYMTGGALWPTAGSWNPTCAMTALSMDLADKLTAHVAT